MRVLGWDERVVDAVKSVKEVSDEGFEGVCKMAVLVFHTDKPSRRRVSKIANQCNWTLPQTEQAVLAIAKIMLDAAKAKLAPEDLRSTLMGMNMSDHHIAILTQLFMDHHETIRESSSRTTSLGLPEYRSLNWRIDVELSNRMARHATPQPIVTLSLNTITRNGGMPQHSTTCMRADYSSLLNLQRKLETALKESDSEHSSRIQRYLH